jgi:hypothetical protein
MATGDIGTPPALTAPVKKKKPKQPKRLASQTIVFM